MYLTKRLDIFQWHAITRWHLIMLSLCYEMPSSDNMPSKNTIFRYESISYMEPALGKSMGFRKNQDGFFHLCFGLNERTLNFPTARQISWENSMQMTAAVGCSSSKLSKCVTYFANFCQKAKFFAGPAKFASINAVWTSPTLAILLLVVLEQFVQLQMLEEDFKIPFAGRKQLKKITITISTLTALGVSLV